MRNFGSALALSFGGSVKITCQNMRLVDGKAKECGRFLVDVPQVVLTMLRATQGDADARIIVRCPSCGHGGRFAEVRYTNDLLVFRTLEERVELGPAVVFEDVFVMAEGGL